MLAQNCLLRSLILKLLGTTQDNADNNKSISFLTLGHLQDKMHLRDPLMHGHTQRWRGLDFETQYKWKPFEKLIILSNSGLTLDTPMLCGLQKKLSNFLCSSKILSSDIQKFPKMRPLIHQSPKIPQTENLLRLSTEIKQNGEMQQQHTKKSLTEINFKTFVFDPKFPRMEIVHIN